MSGVGSRRTRKAMAEIVLFANTDWYLYNFRRSLAESLRSAGHEVLLLSPPGPYGEKLRTLGFRWEPVPMARRSLNPLRELRVFWWLFRLFRRERPALVHGFTIKCAVYGSLAARLARVPARVNAIAGMGYVFTNESLQARLLRPIVRTLLRASLGGRDALLVLQNPDDVAVSVRAGWVDPSRVRLIRGSGVDCDRFSPPPSRQGTGPMRVVLPARLLWDKGVAEFVAAARQLRGNDIEFMLAGAPDPGNPAAVPGDTIRGWVEEGLVQWLGQVQDMPSLFATVDVVALPSYREGLPKGLIEAAACGCTLVATDVPGCREVVADGVDGLLVPARSAAALAEAIDRLHRDPGLRKRLGSAARRKAVEQFDEKIVIRETITAYRELLKRAD